MITLDLQGRQPIYEQLKDRISELIMLGELGPNDQLPSVRSFARELGINPNTVQKAYQDLERDGIIYSVAGRGSYISHDSGAISQLQEKRLDQIKLHVSQAAACNLPEERVIGVVREIYRRMASDDTDN